MRRIRFNEGLVFAVFAFFFFGRSALCREPIIFVADTIESSNGVDGSAFVMSRGPAVPGMAREEDLPSADSPLFQILSEGERCLRVTLFEAKIQRTQLVYVEEIFLGKVGSARIESTAGFTVRGLFLSAGWTEPFSPDKIEWVDANTFDLVDSRPQVSFTSGSTKRQIRYVRFVHKKATEFSVSMGVGIQ